MTRIERLNVLLERGYQKIIAEKVVEALMDVSSILENPLNVWLETGEESEVVIDGFSLKKLMTEKNMKYPAALLSMDWLIKEPDIAIPIMSKHYHILENSRYETF